jgi:ribonuclease P protein component
MPPKVSAEKFKLNKEFRRMYGKGKCLVDPALVTYLIRSGRKDFRLGITCGKKVGGAVQRNRARRLICAAYREVIKEIKYPIDVVFVARSRILTLKSTDVASIMRQQFIREGLIDQEKTL